VCEKKEAVSFSAIFKKYANLNITLGVGADTSHAKTVRIKDGKNL
jgi:hypothetical protein